MFLTNERTLLYSLYALGMVLWFVLWKFFSNMMELVLPIQTLRWISIDQLMAIIAMGISLAAIQMAWKNQKAKDYGVDVVVETKKVSWPNRKELQGSTIIVLVMVILTTIIIWSLDKIFDSLIKLIF